LNDSELKYEPSGNLREKKTLSATYTYTYDDLYRLSGVSSADPANDEAFTYDDNDNRSTQTGIAGEWNYSAQNELEDYDNGSISFVHDENGNIVTKSDHGVITNFVYDPANQLVKVERADGSPIAEYGYDPFGRRISKEVAGIKTFFLYSDEGLVAELNSAGVVTRTYGYQPDSTWSADPIYQKEGQEFHWYLNDLLGTPKMMVDEEGVAQWTATHQAFGQATISTASHANNLRFPGQYLDEETGLHYNWHRYYDPMLGRYLTPDPIGLEGGLNLYGYVSNNPVNLTDPEGLLFDHGFPFPTIDPGSEGGGFCGGDKPTPSDCRDAFLSCISGYESPGWSTYTSTLGAIGGYYYSASAVEHAASRLLTYPLRSSIYRSLLGRSTLSNPGVWLAGANIVIYGCFYEEMKCLSQ